MSEQPHGAEQETTAPPESQAIHVDKYEVAWMRIAGTIIVVFIAAILVAAFSFGIGVPGASGRIDPAKLDDPTSPFSKPGLRKLADNKYEAYMVAQTWMFVPDKLEVPVGSEVTFYVTSRDVQHGFKLQGTNVNFMALPGQISVLSAKFDKPGIYDYICHEYCGYVAGAPIGHHTMYGQLVVLPTHAISPTAMLTSN